MLLNYFGLGLLTTISHRVALSIKLADVFGKYFKEDLTHSAWEMSLPFPLMLLSLLLMAVAAGYRAVQASLAQQRNEQWVWVPHCSLGLSVPSPLHYYTRT